MLQIGDTPVTYMFLGTTPDGYPKPVEDVWLGDKWVYSKPVEDRIYTYTTAGTWYIPAPDFDCEIDVLVFGGGGGGQVGHGGNGRAGSGGASGDFTHETLTGINGGEIKVVVGAGGRGGNGSNGIGGNGGDSTVGIGFLLVRAKGGVGGGQAGDSGVQGYVRYKNVGDFFGFDHSVVVEKELARSGRGGDGGFLGNYSNGEPGNNGYAWLRIRKVMPD